MPVRSRQPTDSAAEVITRDADRGGAAGQTQQSQLVRGLLHACPAVHRQSGQRSTVKCPGALRPGRGSSRGRGRLPVAAPAVLRTGQRVSMWQHRQRCEPTPQPPGVLPPRHSTVTSHPDNLPTPADAPHQTDHRPAHSTPSRHIAGADPRAPAQNPRAADVPSEDPSADTQSLTTHDARNPRTFTGFGYPREIE